VTGSERRAETDSTVGPHALVGKGRGDCMGRGVEEGKVEKVRCMVVICCRLICTLHPY
jgi:hypothetical protein